MKKLTLEKQIESLWPAEWDKDADQYSIYAFELYKEDGMWSVNDGWRMASGQDFQGVLESARGRWEAFKVNYLPKARVKDIQDTGFDCQMQLEVDCVSFLEIRKQRD